MAGLLLPIIKLRKVPMKQVLLAAALLAPTIAMAQPAPQKPEMVLFPREVAEVATNWIASPNAGTAVQLFLMLRACLADNPDQGRVVRMGQDQCPAVTAALAERDAEVASLKKQIEDAKKPSPSPEPPK